MAFKYTQGFYKIKNPEKYKGDINQIVYRSSYELKFMNFLDQHPNVLKWASEEIAIPYIWNGERHRYFVDFYVEFKAKDGSTRKMLVEIKPYQQTQPPKAPQRKTRKSLETYQNAILTYTKNVAKWEHAKDFCERNGVNFVVLTENELFKSSKWQIKK